MSQDSYDFMIDSKTRIVYIIDNQNFRPCLCQECGSSFARKFFLKSIFGRKFTILKLKGCINYNCDNYYKKPKDV